MLAKMEDRWKYDSMNIQDISKQITPSRHIQHTFSTTDINNEIRKKPYNYQKYAVREREKTVGSHFTCKFYNSRTY
jgi:hypothetical protein